MTSNARIRRPGTCSACHRRWQDDDPVILTRSGDITCASHLDMFVSDAIAASGPYREIRRQRTKRLPG